MDLGLAGKCVLVTGGVHGIGREIAKTFAAEGANVAVTYRTDEAGAEELAGRLGAAEGRALALPYDLADPDGANHVVGAVADHWGALDVLVANAVRRGARRTAGQGFEDVDEADWHRVVDANLVGTIRIVQATAARMRRRSWGRIALVSSHNALKGGDGQEFYGAAKAGMHGLVASLARDVGTDGILANTVCPGLTLTERVLDALPAQARDKEIAATPTGRLSTPQEVANAVVFLCSAANGNISGESLTIAGGR